MLISFVNITLFSAEKDTLRSFPGYRTREMQNVLQLWQNTSNAAGMAFSFNDVGSNVSLGTYSEGGEHHRVQEGSSNRGLLFSTERYDRFTEHILVKGAFQFNINSEGDRAWSDVFNTYNSNPYIYGSSVRGDYETQKFDLNLKLYSLQYGRFNFGLAIDYHVADMARQRDPRSRSYLLDYSVIPSLVYSTGNHKMGLNIIYNYSKEKMPGLSTVQTDPNLKYYTFKGLQNAIGTIGGYRGFSRQFIGNSYGGDIQYGYDGDDVKIVTSAGIIFKDEDTFGDKKQSPGSYNVFKYRFSSDILWKKNNFLNRFSARALFQNGGADELRQNLIATRDTLTGVVTQIWETLYEYKNRYVVETTDVEVKWDLYNLAGLKGYRWRAGVYGAYSSFENIYYLPTSSYSVSKFKAGIDGSLLLWKSNDSEIIAEGSLIFGITSDSDLSFANNNEIYDNIYSKDLLYHDKNTIDVGGKITYTFPLKFSKKTELTGFARLYGGNTFVKDNSGWYNAGIAIGLLTL